LPGEHRPVDEYANRRVMRLDRDPDAAALDGRGHRELGAGVDRADAADVDQGVDHGATLATAIAQRPQRAAMARRMTARMPSSRSCVSWYSNAAPRPKAMRKPQAAASAM